MSNTRVSARGILYKINSFNPSGLFDNCRRRMLTKNCFYPLSIFSLDYSPAKSLYSNRQLVLILR